MLSQNKNKKEGFFVWLIKSKKKVIVDWIKSWVFPYFKANSGTAVHGEWIEIQSNVCAFCQFNHYNKLISLEMRITLFEIILHLYIYTTILLV